MFKPKKEEFELDTSAGKATVLVVKPTWRECVLNIPKIQASLEKNVKSFNLAKSAESNDTAELADTAESNDTAELADTAESKKQEFNRLIEWMLSVASGVMAEELLDIAISHASKCSIKVNGELYTIDDEFFQMNPWAADYTYQILAGIMVGIYYPFLKSLLTIFLGEALSVDILNYRSLMEALRLSIPSA